MKTLLVLLVLLALVPGAVNGQAVTDGVYLAGAAGDRALATADGTMVLIGAPAPLPAMRVRVDAQDNANSRYALTIEVGYDPALDRGPGHVLVVSGVAHRQTGSGSSENVSSQLHFFVDGRERAVAAGQLFGVTPRFRRHPGHALLVELVPSHAVYAPGVEVKATLRLTNVGATPFAFMKGGRNRGRRDNQYAFAATLDGRPLPDAGDPTHFGGLAIRVVLAPGAVFTDEIDLRLWYAFDKPGHYGLVGSYYMDFVDPAGERYPPIWNDYATADALIRIEAPAAK